MMSLTHTQAREWMEAEVDGLLSAGDRQVLETHLEGCTECRSYMAELQRLEVRLNTSLKHRWPFPQVERGRLVDVNRAVKDSTRGGQMFWRLTYAARPVFELGAVITIMAIMAWVIGSVATGTTLTAENIPGLLPATLTPTPTLTADSSAQVTTCAGVAGAAGAQVRDWPATPNPVIAVIEAGQTVPVIGLYWTEGPVTSDVWVLVSVQEMTGWASNQEIAVAGDCSAVAVYTPATLPQNAMTPPPTPAPTNDTATQVQVSPVPQATGTAAASVGCSVTGLVDTPIYSGPHRSYTVIDTFPMGVTSAAIGWFYGAGYDTFIQINWKGAPGWVPANLDGLAYVGMDGSCSELPFIAVSPLPPTNAPTPTYQPTPDPTATATGVTSLAVCTGTTTFDAMQVLAKPSYASAVLVTLRIGDRVTVLEIYNGGEANVWYRVDTGSVTGWITAIYSLNFDRPCGNIGPTPIPPISVPLDFTFNAPLDIGHSTSFTRALPGDNGDRAHVIAVKLDGIPQGNSDPTYYRTIQLLVECSGNGSTDLRWGYYGNSPLTLACGESINVNMGMGWDSQYYVLQIPPDAGLSISYEVTITVGAYTGP
jgi:hypothetical protein